MCNIKTLLNNKGITIIEAMIAAFLTAVAVISLMPMQSTSLRAGFRADYLGRAAGIMQAELEAREYFIMNQDNIVTVTGATTPIVQNIKASGSAGVVQGDATFQVFTLINPVPATTNAWIVNVRVTWTGGSANGIRSSIIATRQYNF